MSTLSHPRFTKRHRITALTKRPQLIVPAVLADLALLAIAWFQSDPAESTPT